MGAAASFSAHHDVPKRPKFSKRYCRIIKRYLPHFPITEPSGNDDRLTAFAHWERVFKENIHMDAHHAVGSGTKIGLLYENFYKYLFENYPHMKPLFQASKVMNLALVHLKIGVKPEDFDPLGDSLVQAMRLTCGGDWDEAIENAWNHIYCHAAILILVNIPDIDINSDDD
ncbi:hypothetical protein G195_004034 [Phytophthora kernoviae 00238/432]|uniref:Globin domain-containing protein n=2 Tax=Phytophthora kernoviae TaxID=325452 RepID=A0A8T0M913_9STRA|nr:hypothetical protein G195_004034 [Phytophthora kernoviae 00238/432]KAG2532396.1 hypothetical protein JM16_000387 [Phytophthora kernoviae]